MSAKDVVLGAIQGMPDSASVGELVRAINDRLKHSMNADWATDELSEEEWRLFTAHGLSAELADAREDIYTLDDGEPLHEPV